MKCGIDPALQRIEPEQMGGETVQGSDLSFFEILQSSASPSADFVGGQSVPLPEFLDRYSTSLGP
ncbi:MAG TPA: hypothetical protein VF819_01710, partial [Nitrospira sp.]